MTGGLSKRARKGKLANEEDGKGNEEDGNRNEKKRRGNRKERRERERKRKTERKEGAKRTRKGKAGPEKEGDDGNPETQPGTPVSSLMQVQKENSPKTVPTRPAALRRGAEKDKRWKGKREEDSKSESGTGKGRRRRKPGNTAGNAGVKFDAGSKGKLTKNRPDETGGSPKRRRKGQKKGTGNGKRTRKGKGRHEEEGDAGAGKHGRDRRCQV